MEPVLLCGGQRDEEARRLLYDIGVNEKHWPPAGHDSVEEMLSVPAVVIGVFDEVGQCLGAAKVTYHQPFRCELPPFDYSEPQEGRVSCFVELIAVRADCRRKPSKSAAVLDALVKGLYCYHRDNTGSHILALCEEWTFNILTTAYVGIVGRKVGEGVHYWCGTAVCPGPDCQPTYVCELDMRASEENWVEKRPEFWAYLNA